MSYSKNAAALLSKRVNGVTAFECIDSTNFEAKRMIDAGTAGDAHVLIADLQTDGRGRLGRSFFSPPDKGIYISYTKNLSAGAQNLLLLTSFAGLAVCRAIESFWPRSASPCRIKWPNDIIIDEKKICGILTTLVTDTKNNLISHAIIGIGINVLSDVEEFPKELRSKAGSILSQTGAAISPDELCARLVAQLDCLFFEEDALSRNPSGLLEALRARSFTIGRDVEFTSDSRRLCGRAVDINEDGSLLVTGDFGEKRLTSGEAVVLV